ncbi:hypothetical protein GQ600_24258 [Phytophthora cactorum]|nr:hypothetical protein GQ600_24258 [Phytophthora cactorum]
MEDSAGRGGNVLGMAETSGKVKAEDLSAWVATAAGLGGHRLLGFSGGDCRISRWPGCLWQTSTQFHNCKAKGFCDALSFRWTRQQS